ncbi:Aste57867_707 [Aphanomyces stellatus]|uniref:Aste57867_707 protein n=1 Tax=Aphanomyces stellatus TaxID=120398 RepID=A0A485K6J6_9STRA|nr:hypothetical protein As57867_000706 [Aphanomyces stellatus]VFT77931.1 Aste57867_707 [Aphanomyces stellatus]
MDQKKVDEKHIKEIREFQKSSTANRRCFDCNEMGPQYICLDFNTFICTACSGIHREFSHRIKSISMSTFADTEVKNIIKVGGNEAAQKFWLARFDVNSQPNTKLNSRDRIRNFIRDVYVDRRWVLEEPKPKEVPKKEPLKKAVAPSKPTADFNAFQIAPPPTHHDSAVSFGDFSSFNTQSTEEFADFATFDAHTTHQTGFSADFNSFNSASSHQSVDFFQTPSTAQTFKPFEAPTDNFATFASPRTTQNDPFAASFDAPQSVASPPAKPTADPFAEFDQPKDLFGTFDAPNQTANPFASFDAPAAPAFGSFNSSQNVDPFASPVAARKTDPFASPVVVAKDPFDAFNPPVQAVKTPAPSADPFGAFDSLVEPVAEPISQPKAALDVWGQPPPAKATIPNTPFTNNMQSGGSGNFTNNAYSGQAFVQPGGANFNYNGQQSAVVPPNNVPYPKTYAAKTPFDVNPAYPSNPAAYTSNKAAASLVDPFASLDIGIKSSSNSSQPQQNFNSMSSRPVNQQHFSNQMHQPHFAVAPVAQKTQSSNPFDMF